MMRNKTPSSMQKTYDECYLICSTAVYFEGQVGVNTLALDAPLIVLTGNDKQNNEAEALRSWRSALDQIYYHNAYRAPPTNKPKSETEKALQESLRDMELQCKERVDLLEALRKSREESKDSRQSSNGGNFLAGRPPVFPRTDSQLGLKSSVATIGQGTIPAINYPDLSRPPPLPQRPSALPQLSSESLTERSHNSPQILSEQPSSPVPPPVLPTLSAQPKHKSRTPSPEKRSRMLTTLRTKDGKKPTKSLRPSGGHRTNTPAASSKAAGLAWDSAPQWSGQRLGGPWAAGRNASTTTIDSVRRTSLDEQAASRADSAAVVEKEDPILKRNSSASRRSSLDLLASNSSREASNRKPLSHPQNVGGPAYLDPRTEEDLISLDPPTSPRHSNDTNSIPSTRPRSKSPPPSKPPVDYLSYRNEYPSPIPPNSSKLTAQLNASALHRPSENFRTASLPSRRRSPQSKSRPLAASGISRGPAGRLPSSQPPQQDAGGPRQLGSSDSGEDNTSSSRDMEIEARETPRKTRKKKAGDFSKPSVNGSKTPEPTSASSWEERIRYVKKHLPTGVDESAAKQIFNEIVIRGDEVHWDDVAGLDVAKKALKEAVVYPFLRPDLFMGLREPARGMLLFGPPGTGKTMLARAVATESRSTFFAISASSLTSKWLGESEKLVRALFSLAKALAPSIIFVDEIDSLLSSRGSSEHESTRRIKTEFLIQWSDLQRAAAGKAQTDKEKQEGDASRVLVLAATNMPWAIDEAARRRFVRRQYIPLPEDHVREAQLRTLLGHQKHSLSQQDIEVLVRLTEGTGILASAHQRC